MTKKHNGFNGQTLSGYAICFYTGYVFNFSPGTFTSNAIIFGADNPGHDNKIACLLLMAKQILKELIML